MPQNPKNFPFYNWVPKPVGIIFLIILFLPMITMSGVYSANSGEMMSGLGIQSEHISFAGFCTSIGMAAFSPFFYDLVCYRREKLMCIVGFSILFVLSFICARTESLFILALCSLLMGFVRQVLLMCNLFTLIKYAFGIEATRNLTPGFEPSTEEGWDKLDTEKSASMPSIYFFFMIIGQLGTWLTAWLAYSYEWQYVYYFMMAFMLAGIIIVFFTMPYHRYPTRRFPINFSKFGNVTVFSVMLCSFTYVMVYGKTLDWYSDKSICLSTIVCILSTIAFLYLEHTRRSPYFILDAFKVRTIIYGIILFLLLMFFNSSAMFVNVFTSVGMSIDNWQSAVLGNWVLPGYFIGLVIALICGGRGVHLKWLFALGFLLIGLASLYMYFEVQTAGLYSHMKWPVIIRATGMMLLYSLTAVYANQRMPYRLMSTWVCIMLAVRMVIAPSIGSATYQNVMQYRQQYHITRMSHDYDRMNPETALQYEQTVRGMRYQGKSESESQIMAAMSLKGKIQVQAVISTVKEMAGWTFYGCMICVVLCALVPWRKRRLEELTPEVIQPLKEPKLI